MDRSSLVLTLNHLRDFLEKEAMFLLSAGTRASLLDRTNALLEKAASLGDVLYVGILGGTGVGKSTLINALARREISTSSDRRPFTDRAVIYRHRDAEPGLAKIRGAVPPDETASRDQDEGQLQVRHLVREPDAIHESDSIRDLVLVDLPDFDSQHSANRRTVLAILPALDCVVWVASPEKYADAALYKFVRQTAIDQENFTFVLNKADELVGAQAQRQNLKEVLGDFVFRLRHEAGIEQPRVFSVSALAESQGKASDPALRSEFRKFRDYLMTRRGAKEIASIKSINLREEIARLLIDLNHEVREDELRHLVTAMQEKSPKPSEVVSEPRLRSLEQEKKLSQGILRFLIREDASVGPVRLGMRLLTVGKGLDSAADRWGLENLFHETIQQARDAMQSQAEGAADYADTELILTLCHAEALPPLKEPESLMLQAEKEASASFLSNLASHEKASSGLRCKVTRCGQKIMLSVPVFMLILKLMGPEPLTRWWEHPSVSGLFTLTFHLFTSLFGAEGLTGLVALLICELGVVWFLAAKRLNRLTREAGALARDAVAHALLSWDRVMREVAENRVEAVLKLQEGLAGLQTLNALASAAPTWKSLDIRAKPTAITPESAAAAGKDELY